MSSAVDAQTSAVGADGRLGIKKTFKKGLLKLVRLTLEMDTLRIASFTISTVELWVLLAYYWPLVRVVPFVKLMSNYTVVDLMPYSDCYISDLLFSDAVYRVWMTSLVGMHLCLCCLYVIRLNRAKGPLLLWELGSLGGAWIGWVILTAFYLDVDGRMHLCHKVGAGLFILSSSLYFGLMAWNVATAVECAWTGLESVLFLLVVCLFVISVGTGGVFVASVFDRRIPLGWVFEHAAFVLFVAANLLLFVVDALFTADREPEDAMFQGVRISPVYL